VTTAAELKVALNDPDLQLIRIMEDLSLAEAIAFTRTSRLMVEGACGGGTRACTITPAQNNRTFSDSWGFTCMDWRGYCGEDSPSFIDVCPVPSMPEVGPDGSTCEVGGYVDASGFYYGKSHMDEVRLQCSRACAVILGSSTSSDSDINTDSDSYSNEAVQTRFLDITLDLKQPDQELSLVGLIFDEGNAMDGVGPVGILDASHIGSL
jgi:hypothetical protein